MICQALRISIFNSFHSVTRITYNVHKILQGVPKKWARSDPKWPRPSERTWMAQSGPKWPKIPASHHSPQNFKSTFFLGHPVVFLLVLVDKQLTNCLRLCLLFFGLTHSCKSPASPNSYKQNIKIKRRHNLNKKFF